VVLILDGKVPPSFWDFFRDNELCGPPKGDDDVRPIGMGDAIKKLAFIVFLISTSQVQTDENDDVVAEKVSFNDKYFKDLQYGMVKSGCEIIIHQVHASLEAFPERDHFFADAKMTYQNVPRIAGLNEVRKYFPIIMPFLKHVYGTDSNGWVYSLGNVTAIASKEGFHQGDCLASWINAMAIMPFINGIYDILGDEGFVKFFYDDGNMSGSFEKM
jgi:hypothetical protein